jgi:uncharacterized protein
MAEAGSGTAGPDLLYVFWPVVTSYLRISTHPAVFDEPLPAREATENAELLLGRSHVLSPGEEEGFWMRYRSVTDTAQVRGNLVPDAHLVALMRQNGVKEIWSHDRDFRRFGGITVRDPFDHT